LNIAATLNFTSDKRIQARFISDTCVILPDKEGNFPSIGEGTWIGHFTVLDGSQGLTIGKNCSIASGAHIYSHSTHAKVAKGEEKRVGAVTIGDNVAIGANAVVLYGCHIHSNAIVKALELVKPFTEVKSLKGKEIPEVVL